MHCFSRMPLLCIRRDARPSTVLGRGCTFSMWKSVLSHRGNPDNSTRIAYWVNNHVSERKESRVKAKKGDGYHQSLPFMGVDPHNRNRA
jgi:hypothetical protein